MTKKNTKVLIPAGAQVTEVVEIEDTTPKTVDMQALVAMGVDMKLTKNDIIEYAAVMLEEQVKEKLETSNKALGDLKNSFMAELEKRLESVKNDPGFVEFVATINKIWDVSALSFHRRQEDSQPGSYQLGMYVEDDESGYVHAFQYQTLLSHDYFSPEKISKVHVCVTMSHGGFQSKHKVKIMDAAELAPYRATRVELRKQFDEAKAESHKLEFATKKVRTELTKAILQNSDKGRELLSFLDSSSKTRLKALASKNA